MSLRFVSLPMGIGPNDRRLLFLSGHLSLAVYVPVQSAVFLRKQFKVASHSEVLKSINDFVCCIQFFIEKSGTSI